MHPTTLVLAYLQFFNCFERLLNAASAVGPILLHSKAVCAFMAQTIYQCQIAELGRRDIRGEDELQRMIAEDWVRVNYDGTDDESDSRAVRHEVHGRCL